MIKTYILLLLGLIVMIAFMIKGSFLGAISVGFLIIYLSYRNAMKKSKAFNEAAEAVSKEAYPELYSLIKEKTKDLK